MLRRETGWNVERVHLGLSPRTCNGKLWEILPTPRASVFSSKNKGSDVKMKSSETVQQAGLGSWPPGGL